MWTILLPEKFLGTSKVKSVGSDTGWDLLQPGLDPARVKSRNEKQERIELFFDQLCSWLFSRECHPSRISIKKKH